MYSRRLDVTALCYVGQLVKYDMKRFLQRNLGRLILSRLRVG